MYVVVDTEKGTYFAEMIEADTFLQSIAPNALEMFRQGHGMDYVCDHLMSAYEMTAGCKPYLINAINSELDKVAKKQSIYV